jgi:hypothetical protein
MQISGFDYLRLGAAAPLLESTASFEERGRRLSLSFSVEAKEKKNKKK